MRTVVRRLLYGASSRPDSRAPLSLGVRAVVSAVVFFSAGAFPTLGHADSGRAVVVSQPNAEEAQINFEVTHECSGTCFWYGDASLYPASTACPSTWEATGHGWVENGIRSEQGTVSETQNDYLFGLTGSVVACLYVEDQGSHLVGQSLLNLQAGALPSPPSLSSPSPPPAPPPPPPPPPPASPAVPSVAVHFGGDYRFRVSHPRIKTDVFCNVACTAEYHERASVSRHGRGIRIPALEAEPTSFAIADTENKFEVLTHTFSGRSLRLLASLARRYGQVRFDVYVTAADAAGHTASDHRVLYVLPAIQRHPSTSHPPSSPPAPHEPSGETEGVGSYSHSEDGRFCSEHQCIGEFSSEPGTVAECNDGTFSHSGHIQGACSHHGGVRRD
jgi:hypothetical protein